MGMYDNLIVSGKSKERFKCPEGHFLTSLQTKSFDNSLDDYHLHDDLLYRTRGDGRADTRPPRYDLFRTSLRITSVAVIPLHITTATAVVYTSCEECKPVLYPTTETYRGLLVERRPWCEWEIEFIQGRLRSVKPRKLESRKSIRRELKVKLKTIAVPDDDPKAMAHYEMKKHGYAG